MSRSAGSHLNGILTSSAWTPWVAFRLRTSCLGERLGSSSQERYHVVQDEHVHVRSFSTTLSQVMPRSRTRWYAAWPIADARDLIEEETIHGLAERLRMLGHRRSRSLSQ